MKIAITGHRPSKLDGDYSLKSPLSQAIKAELVKIVKEYKPYQMISGMALGVDTLWADIAIERNISLIAAIPFKGQDSIWPEASKVRYRNILRNAYEIMVTSTGHKYYLSKDFFDKEPKGIFTAALMQKRNEWMVDHADLLVAVWDGTSGGTANAVNYARSKSKIPIITINPTKILSNEKTIKPVSL